MVVHAVKLTLVLGDLPTVFFFPLTVPSASCGRVSSSGISGLAARIRAGSLVPRCRVEAVLVAARSLAAGSRTKLEDVSGAAITTGASAASA